MRRFLALAIIVSACTIPAGGPATLDDTASTYPGVEVAVAVLENDWPESGLELTNVELRSGQGSAGISEDLVVFTPDFFDGVAELVYEVDDGGFTATGTLLVTVEPAEFTVDVPDGFGEVPVFATSDVKVRIESLAGTVQIEASVSEGLDLSPSSCTVDAAQPCQLAVSWAPTGLGSSEFALNVNQQSFRLGGTAVHALDVPVPIFEETVEAEDFSKVYQIENRANSGFQIEVESSNDQIVVETCPVIAPSDVCDLMVLIAAEDIPVGNNSVTADIRLHYGRDGETVDVSFPIEVRVIESQLVRPILVEPLQDTLWVGELATPITFIWEGPPGRDGFLLEVEHCFDADNCTMIGEARTPENEQTLDLKGVIDLFSTRPRLREEFSLGYLEWRVSAVALGDRRKTAESGPIELTDRPFDLIETRFDPEPSPEFTDVRSYLDEFVEFEFVYRSHLLKPARYRLLIEGRFGGRIDSPLRPTVAGLDPAGGDLVSFGEDTMSGALKLKDGLVESFVIYILHPACDREGCFVERITAPYAFYSDPGPD